MNWKKVITNLLLAFVLVSIGHAVGAERTRRALAAAGAAVAVETPAASAQGSRLILYYMHGTFRCATCNRIETLAHDVAHRDFADALADGRLEWRVANFQLEAALAARYGVGASTLVLVRMDGDRERDFRRLDGVWQTVQNAEAFTEYVDGAIREWLEGGE